MREVNVLTSQNQYINDIKTNLSEYAFLGLDTEMLVSKITETGNEIQWPTVLGLPQEREPKSPITNDQTGRFDYHGDGFATELCTQPTYCLESMMSYISGAFYWWNAKYGKSSFNGPSVYKVPKKIVESAHEDAKRLGCMPSLNIYNDPGDPKTLTEDQRTTGCHLHLSHPALKREEVADALVLWADVLVGTTWTFISPENPKIEAKRRKAYGRAGEYRLKTYPTYPETTTKSGHSNGVEYRTLPGMVLHHPAYFTLMFNLYRNALINAIAGPPDKALSLMAKDAINAADKNKATEVLSKVDFTPFSFRLIKYLQNRKLDATSMETWANLGNRCKGHQNYYTENKYNIDKSPINLGEY